MKHKFINQGLLTLSLFVLSLILSAGLGAPTALAACGSSTNVATESELNAAIADFNSQTSACSYTITLIADINLAASTTAINNATANVDLLIDGAGFTVDGQGNSGVRPFEIAANTAVEMRNLTITGSKPATGNHGGGIRNNGGDLTLTTVTLTNNNNPTIFGGGLYNDGGTVTFQNNSVISNNQGESGAGIYNTNGGTLNVYNSIISGNATPYGFGAGIYNASGTLDVRDSTFSGNDGSSGGAAIENDDVASIGNSQFTGVDTVNATPIVSEGKMVIRNSTISGYNNPNQDGAVVATDLTIINTTISNNNMGVGGGIISFGSDTINVINSTISGNTSSINEAGIHMFGGIANIINSTIAGNSRGIDVFDNSGVVNVSNSLIVNSIGVNCSINGTLNVNGTNYADDDTCSGLTNDSAAGTNLGSLQNNGGSTETHALLAGNPAINAGVNALAVDENGNPLTTDQRGDGFPRIIGNTVDVGAFESEFISNGPPTAEAGGPYIVDEGSSVQLDGSGSADAEQDAATLTYAWDFNGDGNYDDATGSSPTFSAVALDGPDSVTVGLQVTDDGGLTATDTAAITINNADPTISSVANNGPIDAGNNATITVTASDPAGANDPLSFEFDCDNDSTYEVGPQAGNSAACFFGADGSFTVNVRVSDGDGGQATASTSVTVEAVDTTPPVITPNVSGTKGNNNWYVSAVTVSFSCADEAGGSGLVTNTVAGMTLTGDGADQSVTNTGECIDNAGNVALPVTVSDIDIDKTAPTASASVSPAANANGWHNGDVTVSFSGSDDTSGIASCDANIILSSEGSGQSASGVCTDNAGNVSATATASGINIDKTAPTASASVSPAANVNGWNNSDVTVSFSGSDALSGIAGCDADVILSSEGSGQSASGVCTDNAGNVSATATASGINLDKTAPVVSVTGVTDGATYILGSVPTAGCETSDALSGVATAASLTFSGGNPDGSGAITATCEGALDNAGNSGVASVTYTVLTPQGAIGDLQADIQVLVDDGVLKPGQANGLTQPLDNAIRSLDKGNTADACNQLQDFIVKVNEKTPDPLDAATAADLIAEADAIRAAIGCE
jgi:hypothetical protein